MKKLIIRLEDIRSELDKEQQELWNNDVTDIAEILSVCDRIKKIENAKLIINRLVKVLEVLV